ncbi:alpha-L-fucosidase [Streptomyces odontomachi]|uniref:alpha-L-fucosidase n=1 Tax=Streptomyces odontomachi TaxID=2944940 RepID=UPI0021090CDC|nr:alpha-L-fucosidase [Streptomyces sp. ODS25]
MAAAAALAVVALLPPASAGAAPTAPAQAAADPCRTPVQPASVLPVEPCDSPDRIVEKAAKIVPRASQVAWQQRKVIAFTHFGMNTFTDREWGSGMEDEDRFDPPSAEVTQWMRAYRAMGAKEVIFTAKHHDGFVLYPTRYTDHSVVASPWWIHGCPSDDASSAARTAAEQRRDTDPSAYWQVRDTGCRNPDGDILGSYVRAAREAGLRVGVYLSPTDGAELPHAWHRDTYIPAIQAKPPAQRSIAEVATLQDAPAPPAGSGRYGNESKAVPRTIPTLVPGDDRAARVASGALPSFEVTEDDYNTYYLNQLYELFTQYGPIDELWLDGANPWAGTGVSEPYDFTTWFKLIRSLSPDTVVFAGPQGTRWVGNESGVARTGEWSVVPATADPATAHNEGLIPGGPQAEDIGSRTVLTGPDVRYLQWFPAEADSSIRPGWFYHPDESPQSPATLVTKYQQSVGRNAVMLLNVPPGTDGRIADADLAALTSFGTTIRDTYGSNLLTAPRALADDDLHTGWSPPGGADTGTLTLTLPHPTTFDQLALGEDITRGQHVERFSVDVWDGARWTAAGAGTTIGHERLLVLPSPVTTTRIRVHIEAARATPHLATVGLYRTAG